MLITAKALGVLTTFSGVPNAHVENATPRTYVLVHGAWSSSGGFEQVKERLEKAGVTWRIRFVF